MLTQSLGLVKRIFVAAAILLAAFPALAAQSAPTPHGESLMRTPPQESVGKRLHQLLPGRKLHFEPSPSPAADFEARGERYLIGLSRQGLRLVFPADGELPASSLGIEFSGALEGELEPRDRLSSVSHHLIGDDPQLWRTSVPHFRRLFRGGLYPGIDAVFYGDPQRLEFDFQVAPGADPAQIRLRLQGADRVQLDDGGDLVITTGGRQLRQLRPLSFQEGPQGPSPVTSRYRLLDGHTVAIEVGEYDKSRPLTIDPVLSFFSYLGGAGNDAAYALLESGNGFFYVCGETASSDFPLQDAFQDQAGGSFDAFFSLVDFRNQSLVFSTFLGGSDIDICRRMSRDGSGNIYLLGQTESLNFPTVNPTQGFRRGNVDLFISKLTPQGDQLLRSTYLGGSSPERAGDIFAAANGGLTVVGSTASFNFPVFQPLQEQPNGSEDLFITRFAPSGPIVFSTLLGGSGLDRPYDVHFGTPSAETFPITIVGETRSPDFPLESPFDSVIEGRSDAFILRFDVEERAVLYSTFIGGDAVDIARAVEVDAFGVTMLAGETDSQDFTLLDGVQSEIRGGLDLFVMRLNTATNALVFSTFLGGSEDDFLNAAKLDASNRIYLAGHTDSADLPTEDAAQAASGGGRDGFVIHLDPTQRRLLSSTYLGGSGRDEVHAVRIDSRGRVLLAGLTDSSGLALESSDLQPQKGAGRDAFIATLVDTFILNFAQFGDGSEAGISFSSRVELVNTDAQDASNFEMRLRNDAGQPLEVDLNGQLIDGRLDSQIAPAAAVRFATDGQGPLQTGSVQVISDLPLSGFVFFEAGEIGATGVGDSPRLRGFVAPVEVSGQNNTGVALMGLGAAQQLQFQLRDDGGETVAEAVLELGGLAHRALFVTELEWDQEVDFSAFQGSLRVQGTQEFSATAIRTQPGQFIVVPVTPLSP
ncbi:MAG TPA: hypothetical protein VLV83_14575 [Acidobacteriota bacterium]|nr:hypothetical protein [Acidobacteriota bacterium]